MPPEKTEKQILEAAYQLFVEKGYSGSSMRDIAARAGIKAGRILDILDGVSGDNAEELLTNAVNKLNKELHSEPGLLNLFFVELVEMGGKHIPQAIEKNFPFDSNFMKQIFQMKDEIRDIREPVLVRAVIGTIFANIMFNWFIGDSKSRRWGTQNEMTDVLLRGILKGN